MKEINGIDVSECEFLECGMCNAQRNCDGYTGIECKYDNENCYYRQLKRLQEENEELKELKCKFKEYCTCDIERLQEENEELKKRCEELDKMTGIFSVRLANKYKQALEEIRETVIKKEQADIKTAYVRKTYERLNKIQNKIDEALNDRN